MVKICDECSGVGCSLRLVRNIRLNKVEGTSTMEAKEEQDSTREVLVLEAAA